MLFEIFKSSNVGTPKLAPLKKAFKKEIVRPSGYKEEAWFVEVSDFDELMKMIDEAEATFIIDSPKGKDDWPSIEIYDDWRE